MGSDKNLKEIYATKNGNTFVYLEVGDFLIPSQFKNYIVHKDDLKADHIFDSKEELKYYSLVLDLKSGKPLSNFKRSKYYKYYISRLKEEYPEYVI